MKNKSSAPDWRHRIFMPAAKYIARCLIRMHISANMITITGFLIVTSSALLIVLDREFWAGLMMLAGSLLDGVDGTVAKLTENATKFGAMLDSVLDRLGEGIVLLALIYIAAANEQPLTSVLAGTTIILSFLVSYTRARAEGLGVPCAGGWFTRAERVIVLAIGLLTGFIVPALSIVAVFSLVTFLQRLYTVHEKTKTKI